MRARTLDEIRAEVRILTDTDDDEHVTDETLKLLANQAQARLHARLVLAQPGRFRSSTDIATTAGTDVYALPSDFMSVETVHLVEGTSEHQVFPFASHERATYQGGSGTQYWTRYSIRGFGSSTQIEFDPDPGSRTYRVRYLTGPTEFEDGPSSIDYTSGWERWIVYDVAAKIAVREESDPRPFLEQWQVEDARISNEARTRDAGVAPAIQDIYGARRIFPRLPTA